MASRRAGLRLLQLHVGGQSSRHLLFLAPEFGQQASSRSLLASCWSAGPIASGGHHGLATFSFTSDENKDKERDRSLKKALGESSIALSLPHLLCPPLLQLHHHRHAGLARLFTTQTPASASPAPTPGKADSKTTAAQKEDAEACDVAVHDYQELRKRLDKLDKPASLKPWYLYLGDLLKGMWSITLAIAKFTLRVPSYLNDYRKMTKEEWAEKRASWWKSIKHELHHYQVGTQLLWLEIKISSRLALKSARGKALTRRERRQLTRTTADMLRLVPMVVILLIPFLEFALPVLLRIFPDMLPSTYEDKLKKEEELKRRLGVRLELARFLQDTIAEMAQDISRRKGGEKSVTAKELYDFVKKVRAGEQTSNSDIVKFAKLFNDELTLENLERVQLVSMCQFVGISPFGTDAFLRSRLTSHLAQIKKDDYDIETEGLENLTEEELRAACRARGMRAPFGEGAVTYMRARMQDWLDLSLHRGLPTSLLLLSRAFTITAMPKDVSEKKDLQYNKLKETIGVIPEELVTTLSYEKLGADHDDVEVLQHKLQILKREEWLIREELARAEAAAAAVKAGEAVETDVQSPEEVAAKAEQNAAATAMLMDALKEAMPKASKDSKKVKVSASSSEEERAEAEAYEREKRIRATIEALMDLTTNSAVTKERRTFLQLMKTEIERVNADLAKKSASKTLVFTGRGLEHQVSGEGEDTEEEQAAKSGADSSDKKSKGKQKDEDGVAKRLSDRVSRMLASIERDIDKVDKTIGTGMQILDKDNDGKISQQELQEAILFVKARLSPEEIHVLLDRIGSTMNMEAGKEGGAQSEVSRIHMQ